jgi:hypothetical protein
MLDFTTFGTILVTRAAQRLALQKRIATHFLGPFSPEFLSWAINRKPGGLFEEMIYHLGFFFLF